MRPSAGPRVLDSFDLILWNKTLGPRACHSPDRQHTRETLWRPHPSCGWAYVLRVPLARNATTVSQNRFRAREAYMQQRDVLAWFTE